VILALALALALGQEPPRPSFAEWLAGVRAEALARGLREEVVDAALADVTEPQPVILERDRAQAETVFSLEKYLARILKPKLILGGREAYATHQELLGRVAERYGVPSRIVVAIWGMESNYGRFSGVRPTVPALATLAWDPRRSAFFRGELFDALEILNRGDIDLPRLKGSWAGAMGQTQFMPSSFLAYAAAYSGSDSPDIWTKVPDILASIANYFQAHGWKAGVDWGFEVVVPEGFDYRRSHASFAEWAGLGLRRADATGFPASGDAILFFPSGASGPAFLVTENFIVIKRYNNSDAYALAAGYLADRLRGAGSFRAAWPKDDRQLTLPERIGLQRKLAELGYKVNDFQGRIDFELRDVIREVQTKFGMLPDGNPTVPLLDALGITPR
jgi:membrane-bound lytic murein transglycosylase B